MFLYMKWLLTTVVVSGLLAILYIVMFVFFFPLPQFPLLQMASCQSVHTSSLLFHLRFLHVKSNNKLALMEGPGASEMNELFENFIEYLETFNLFVYFRGLYSLRIKLLKVLTPLNES